MDQIRTISVRGELLQMLPEKAVHWPARETLLVADTHFGKAATFRSFGIPVPDTTLATLSRLTRILEQTSARRLVVLGDLIHSNIKDRAGFEAMLRQWRESHHHLEILLLRGNHDRGRNDLFAQLQINVQKSCSELPFEFSHDPGLLAKPELYGLCGHVHPQVALAEAKKKLRLPCFWFGEKQGLIPAFGDFTGCATINPTEGDMVFVIADGQLVKLSEHAPSQAIINRIL